ncbi:heptaprenyl diphosphate synthase component II [Paenibacillus aurantius]|uniref:Heptaprenyl diphosphate synthase component II n=1 Tax=Paenibacillus aurantius TaxID=2918900 RepID=A0AA96RFR5_9BACL|nr:heptaprenyl diphosphate synthase component II [Paenibacillus aurantius]WNQ09284.1 heptaprenyl diphosphate synthase component II [Paenibacillus aurantius]
MKIIDIYSRYKKDLANIEKELESSVQSDHALLNETSVHLLKAGGKRIRPVFVLLAGRFGNYDLETLKNVAVSMELIHMASLVHDDVIDDAATRRGQPTVKSKWDNRIAMYTGDYIFARALGVVTRLPQPEIHQIMSHAIVEMSVGEMEQIRFFFHTGQTVRDYLLRIKRKTAYLIAISCQLGAVAAGASASVCDKLYRFGYNVGMAFQIRDDVLDLNGTEQQIGKPPGSDIKQGNITLPVLFALQDPQRKVLLLEQIESIREAEGQGDVTPFLEAIRRSGGVKRAEDLASRYIDRAIEALDGLPARQAKKDLIRIAHFVGNRSY